MSSYHIDAVKDGGMQKQSINSNIHEQVLFYYLDL